MLTTQQTAAEAAVELDNEELGSVLETSPGPRTPKKKSKYGGIHARDNFDGTVMALIPFLGYLLFTLFPMALSLVVSFTELHSYYFEDMKFIFLDNYIEIFKSKMFYRSLGNSLYFTLSVPINMGASLFIAHLLTKHVKLKGFARTILFMPTICSGVGVTLMWSWIYEPQHGVLNTIFTSASWIQQPITWCIRLWEDLFDVKILTSTGTIGFTTNVTTFMPSVLFMWLWKSGTNIVLMQSALANVDESLKEAARIDGATEFQVFWKIIFPGVTPTLFYQLVMNFLAAMQEMSVMQVLAKSGLEPGYAPLTLAYYQYRMAFVDVMTDGFGMGCAMGWVIALMIIIVTRVQFWASKKWVNYD